MHNTAQKGIARRAAPLPQQPPSSGFFMVAVDLARLVCKLLKMGPHIRGLILTFVFISITPRPAANRDKHTILILNRRYVVFFKILYCAVANLPTIIGRE